MCPVGVTAVQIECWGGGAGGVDDTGPSAGGGGGGGGAYSKLNTLSVTPGTSYTVNVGAGGGSAAAGGDTWFSTTGTVIAKGGAVGSGTTGGIGGSSGLGGRSIPRSKGPGASNNTRSLFQRPRGQRAT